MRDSGSRQRRRTGWENGPRGSILPGAVGKTIFPIGQLSLEDGQTVVRIRGELNAFLLVSAAGNPRIESIGFGICVVTEQAFLAGATAIPGPLSEMFWEGWMWHQLTSFETNPAFVLPSNRGPGSERFTVDSKAMRKFDEGNVLVAVVELADLFNSAAARFILDSRILLKLP